LHIFFVIDSKFDIPSGFDGGCILYSCLESDFVPKKMEIFDFKSLFCPVKLVKKPVYNLMPAGSFKPCGQTAFIARIKNLFV
jgi:hypothetical protein